MQINVQYSHHSHDESESKTISDPMEMVKNFDEFDWSNEVNKANQLQKCSPTLSLLKNSQEHMIWVSAYGEKDHYSFVSGCSFPGEVSSFMGLVKKQGTVTLQTDGLTIDQAREVIKLFISGSYDQLSSLYKCV